MIDERSAREALIALHETEGIGWLTMERIVASGRMADAERMREADWQALGLSAAKSAAAAAGLQPEAQERRRKRHARGGMTVITRFDERYPTRLKQIERPPWVLYCRGRLEMANNPCIAIVGTRMATAYGKKVAEDLAAQCAEQGLTIVSGLARGIDTSAHVGALPKPGGTIAVLGTPVDRPYPAENRPLHKQIGEQGLLLSEVPPDSAVHPGLFPLRNRIIAGLSLGVVVAEAGEGSGALNTAAFASQFSRDVFVVPGPITSPRSRGGLLMLRDSSAKPVLDATDILEEYRHLLPAAGAAEPTLHWSWTTAAKAESLSPDESRVLDLLLDRPRSIDELCGDTGMPFGLLHAVLLSLLIKRRIHQQPGSVYHVL